MYLTITIFVVFIGYTYLQSLIKFSTLLLFANFAFCIIVALISTGIIYFAIWQNKQFVIIHYLCEDYSYIKFALFSFIILNGLLCPFLCPFLWSIRCQNYEFKRINKKYDDIDFDLKNDLEKLLS